MSDKKIAIVGVTVDGNIIHFDGADICYYFGFPIAQRKDGKVSLDRRYWDSKGAIGKCRNAFLGEGLPATRRKLISGEYSFTYLDYAGK